MITYSNNPTPCSRYKSILRIALVLFFIQSATAFADSSAARVSFLRGAVTASNDTSSEVRQLKRGDMVEVGDVIETDAKSVVQIIFSDQTVMYIKSDSKVKLDAFRFQGDAGAEEDGSVTEVLKGSMRSITGLIGQQSPENVKYKTGDTTIGIRGTAVQVDYDANSVSTITFDYGHGFVQARNPGFCIRSALTYGDTLIMKDNDAIITTSDREQNDPSEVARRLVHATPDETKALASKAGKVLPFEDSLLTLAMLREVSQFNSEALSSTVEGMSSSVGTAYQESLVRNAAMMYPTEGPEILEAATLGNVDITVAVSGVMCGLQGQSSELTQNVIHKAVQLGTTKSQAEDVLNKLRKHRCS